MSDVLEKLSAPFDDADIKYRIQSLSQNQDKALLLPYIDARAVCDRLDSVLGIDGWKDQYTEWQSDIPQSMDYQLMATVFSGDTKRMETFVKSVYSQGVKCTLSIKIGDTWISKEDGASNTDVEATKGGISQALRRAAVKFGIGRYLYKLPPLWISCSTTFNQGQDSVYFRGAARYFTRPDLSKFLGGGQRKPEKTTKEKIQNAATSPAPAAMDKATFTDFQSRLLKLSSNNTGAMELLSKAPLEKESMGMVKKFLGCCFKLYPSGHKTKNVIEDCVRSDSPKFGEAMLILKNSVMELEVMNG